MSQSFLECDRKQAEAALSQCLPNASISPDQFFEAASLLDPKLVFQRLPNVESLSKNELFDAIFLGQEVPESQVFLIADALLPSSAYTRQGPFIREAVLEHPLFFFDGDVFFIWPQAGLVTVFHHEGGFFHVHAKRNPTSAGPNPILFG